MVWAFRIYGQDLEFTRVSQDLDHVIDLPVMLIRTNKANIELSREPHQLLVKGLLRRIVDETILDAIVS